MGDGTDQAREQEEYHERMNCRVLTKDLQRTVRAAFKAYPHHLNKLDIIYRTALIKLIAGEPALLTCDAAKKEVDELLLEDET